MQRLAAVNGLVALVGSESYLIQVKQDPLKPHVNVSKKKLLYVVKISSTRLGHRPESVPD